MDTGSPATDAATPCVGCGAPMSSDQRYCLHCGARRAHLPGVRERLRSSLAAVGAGGRQGSAEAAVYAGLGAVEHRGVSGAAHGTAAPAVVLPATRPANNTVSVLAGVGVLLLAMGVGLLIGRASSSSPSTRAPASQVISVATTGVSTTSTTPTTTTPAKQAGKSATKPSSSSSSSSEVGQTPSKPAPASVLKNLRTGGSGQSYEQKSKNLPNVVSTG